MAKRKETLELEQALFDSSREKRIYGCEEITIGFYNNGHGNEIVDFMTMDPKGIIKCYEIKVTLADLKSKAKKSWYGHFNYLVISDDLWKKIDNIHDYIPDGVGVFVGTSLYSVVKAKRQQLSTDDEMMLKESMIRSMSYKIDKYKDANNLARKKADEKRIRELEKERNEYRTRMDAAERNIRMYEKYKARNDGLDDICFEDMARNEYEKWRRNKELR